MPPHCCITALSCTPDACHPCSGQATAVPTATSLPLAAAIPAAWLAAPAVPSPEAGVVVTIHDRRVRLAPSGASLYKQCRQWVQNDSDLGGCPEVRLGFRSAGLGRCWLKSISGSGL